MKLFFRILNSLFWSVMMVLFVFILPMVAMPDEFMNTVWNSGNHLQYICLRVMLIGWAVTIGLLIIVGWVATDNKLQDVME